MLDKKSLAKAKANNVQAIFEVADAYYFGKGVEENNDKDFELFSRVVALDPGFSKVYSRIGRCYEKGWGTAVYSSYDCPQVWTLRRFRDYKLAASWYGRLFIHVYYAISPTVVKLFGRMDNRFWRSRLDKMVAKLQKQGYEDDPYND